MSRSISYIDSQIGENIHKCRLAAGMTMKQLAEAMDHPVTYQQIDKYERGINRTSSSTLVDISRVLGIEVLTLLLGLNISSVPIYDSAVEANFVREFQSIDDEHAKSAIRTLVRAVAMGLGNKLSSSMPPKKKGKK